MKLTDLRRLAIRKQLRLRFPISEAMDCVINEHGILQVPSLKQVPSFQIQDHLNSAERFRVEVPGSDKNQQVSRTELEKMVAALSPASASVSAHDED